MLVSKTFKKNQKNQKSKALPPFNGSFSPLKTQTQGFKRHLKGLHCFALRSYDLEQIQPAFCGCPKTSGSLWCYCWVNSMLWDIYLRLLCGWAEHRKERMRPFGCPWRAWAFEILRVSTHIQAVGVIVADAAEHCSHWTAVESLSKLAHLRTTPRKTEACEAILFSPLLLYRSVCISLQSTSASQLRKHSICARNLSFC